jgi:DNA-binding transcriptional ArsR family regulator
MEHQRPRWTFLTSHARVLRTIARDPAARLRSIGAACDLSERTVQVVIADLGQARYLLRRRVGQRNQYTLNLDAPLRHPAEADLSVRALVELAGDEVSQQPKAASASATDS